MERDVKSPAAARLWLERIGLALMRRIALLPVAWQFGVGRLIGRLLFRFSPSRRHIAETNVRLCFGHLSASEQRRLVDDIFRANGINIVETAIAWFRNPGDFSSRVTISGLEQLRDAHARGKGVLLVGAHFSSMEIGLALLSLAVDFAGVYRRNKKNPTLEQTAMQGRQRFLERVIERKDIRTMFRHLEAGGILWYAADHDYGARHSVFVPFFGVPAATITAAARLARHNSSAVFFATFLRDEANLRWIIDLQPVPDYPSDDPVADARRLNAILEEALSADPSQYLWLHRRFKTRPPGEAKVY